MVWHRWPLVPLAFFLLIYGGLWTLMLFFASAGKPIDDRKLDTDAQTIQGLVTRVESTETFMEDGSEAVRVNYEFSVESTRMFGFSFAAIGPRNGDTVEVQYLADAPHVNRIAGGRLSLLGDYVTTTFIITVIPGVAVLLTWIVGVLRLRDLLVHGDVAVAHVLAVRTTAWPVPVMLRVHFSFRDHRARECTGHHWVRARSRLGLRLSTSPSSIAIVHDRDQTHRHHLVIADEFAT